MILHSPFIRKPPHFGYTKIDNSAIRRNSSRWPWACKACKRTLFLSATRPGERSIALNRAFQCDLKSLPKHQFVRTGLSNRMDVEEIGRCTAVFSYLPMSRRSRPHPKIQRDARDETERDIQYGKKGRQAVRP